MEKTLRSSVVVWVLVAFALVATSRARADGRVGAVRAGVHVPIVSLLGLDRDPSGGGSSLTSHPAYQLGPIPIFGVDVGYQLHEWVSICAQLVGGAFGSTQSNTSSIAGGGIVPRVEVGMPSGIARLYGAFEFGLGFFGAYGSSCSGPGCNPTYGAYTIGGEVGMHVFADRSVSLDPYLSFRYYRAFDLDTGAFIGQLGVAITAWIGGAPATTAAAE